MDWIERLRGLARLDWPDKVRVLVGTLSEAEWRRLEELVRRGGEPTRGAVRACLGGVRP